MSDSSVALFFFQKFSLLRKCEVRQRNCSAEDMSDSADEISSLDHAPNESMEVLSEKSDGIFADDSTASTPRQEVIVIILIRETFAFGMTESLDAVFIPATAFDPDDGRDLTETIVYGDCVMVSMDSLPVEHCRCKWIANEAIQISEPDIWSALFDALLECDESHLQPYADAQNEYKGYAKVYFVSERMAYAHSCFHEVIACPMLTWIGGNSGNIEANGLNEIMRIGDKIYVEAYRTGKGWRAQRWAWNEPAKWQNDSFTQTTMTSEQMILRAVGPELGQFLRQRLPSVLSYWVLQQQGACPTNSAV